MEPDKIAGFMDVPTLSLSHGEAFRTVLYCNRMMERGRVGGWEGGREAGRRETETERETKSECSCHFDNTYAVKQVARPRKGGGGVDWYLSWYL